MKIQVPCSRHVKYQARHLLVKPLACWPSIHQAMILRQPSRIDIAPSWCFGPQGEAVLYREPGMNLG